MGERGHSVAQRKSSLCAGDRSRRCRHRHFGRARSAPAPGETRREKCGWRVQSWIFCLVERGGDWAHGKGRAGGSGAAHGRSSEGRWGSLCVALRRAQSSAARGAPGAGEGAGQGQKAEAASELGVQRDPRAGVGVSGYGQLHRDPRLGHTLQARSRCQGRVLPALARRQCQPRRSQPAAAGWVRPRAV